MASRYRSVKPIGQGYPNTCWAASLAWWLRATRKATLEEWEIMDDEHYSDLWDRPDGSTPIDEPGLLKIMTDPRWGMKHQKILSGRDLSGPILAAHLNFGPIYIGYYDVVGNNNHVNVIFDIDGPLEYPRVWAMEPQYKRNSDGTYLGMHVDRGIGYYRGHQVILASPSQKVN